MKTDLVPYVMSGVVFVTLVVLWAQLATSGLASPAI
jgi:hypothetical protein